MAWRYSHKTATVESDRRYAVAYVYQDRLGPLIAAAPVLLDALLALYRDPVAWQTLAKSHWAIAEDIRQAVEAAERKEP